MVKKFVTGIHTIGAKVYSQIEFCSQRLIKQKKVQSGFLQACKQASGQRRVVFVVDNSGLTNYS